ncbi:hypothetical protein [Blastococcus sp. TF02A-35]|uniref:hypothetical protein n=1 Tax=Blastococcus sp. TF02A-35 TaxID=2559612 RepID=UPI00142F621C|nr:hypothetical protein [Blastococcus sp. TF02A_35]
MHLSRPLALGLLTVLAGLTACSAQAPAVQEAGARSPEYVPPAGAPDLCAGLVGSAGFLDIPAAVGELSAGVGGVDGRSRLAAARGELRGLVDGVSAEEHPQLRAAADALLAALLGVLEPPLTDATREALLVSMDEFTAQLAPVCEYPS